MATYLPKPCLLAFVDALGFSRYVKRKPSPTLDIYFDVFNLMRSSWPALAGKGAIKFQLIGDSIVLIMELEGELSRFDEREIVITKHSDFAKKLWNFCYGVGEIQRALALQDVWTRGAIVYDFLSFDPESNVLVGPAFHRAYDLERNAAKYPRIIVDPELVNATDFSDTSDFISRVNGDAINVLVDFENSVDDGDHFFKRDVPTFVDFLSIPLGGKDSAEVGTIETIVSLIRKNLRGELQHSSKYRWLSEYVMYWLCSRTGKAIVDRATALRWYHQLRGA